MIRLTRFDGSKVVVNAEMIKFIEDAPDTIVTLTSDQKILVLETVDEVIESVIKYKRLACGSLPQTQGGREPEEDTQEEDTREKDTDDIEQ